MITYLIRATLLVCAFFFIAPGSALAETDDCDMLKQIVCEMCGDESDGCRAAEDTEPDECALMLELIMTMAEAGAETEEICSSTY